MPSHIFTKIKDFEQRVKSSTDQFHNELSISLWFSNLI